MKPLTEYENTLWTALFELSGDAMVVLRTDGSVYRANRRYADMLGYTLDEINSLHLWDWDVHFSQDELLEMIRAVGNSAAHFETKQRRKDGSLIEVDLSNNGATYRGEKLVFCIVRDITGRKEAERKLRQSEERLQRIASQVPGALFQYRMAPDGTRSFPYFSEGVLALGGLSWEDLSGTDAESVMSRILPEDVAGVEANTQKSAKSLSQVSSVFRIKHGDGSIRWIESNSIPEVEEDGSILWTGILLDITRRKQAEDQVLAMAITDGLTGISNRQEIQRLLEQEIKRADRYAAPLSLLMYDLDHFKRVNDRFGHAAGDDVLKTVSTLVNQNIRDIDHHGRWGGEEFIVILPQTGLEEAISVGEKLRQAIAGHRFDQIGTVTVSFGVAELASQESSRSLAQRVDEALYRAKERGRNRVEA